MGIQGLLPLLKSIMVPIHVKQLDGCCVAVDTYSWLHKGALSCSKELCKGLPTSRHIDYCMYRVNLLRHYGVKPILVFDGGFLPMKTEQENKRARGRKENLARALEHEANGNSSAAYECFQKAVDISPKIAHELIQVLKQENVSYVVAPYEADAQMTFLAISNQVDAIITEDSDLIPFGCPRIIFKMDKFGQAVEFQSSLLNKNKDLSFLGFTKQMVLEMCILSGCDYLQSLPGMGLKRAHALITRFKSYDKVIKHLKYSAVSVPPLYEESFKKAILTFQHQRVYDMMTDDIVHMSEIPDNVSDDLDFLGPLLPRHIAEGIAKGDIDPFTRIPFQSEDATTSKSVAGNSVEVKKFNPESQRKKLDLPVQKNLLTKYFCFASIETKRKFKAPRLSPKQSSPLDNHSDNPKEVVHTENASSERNDSLTSSPHYDDSDKMSPAKSLVEHRSSIEAPDLAEYQSHGLVEKRKRSEITVFRQSGTSVHKPYLAPHVEDCKKVTVEVEGKTKTENRKVIVRSKYFQHKQASKNNQDKRCTEKSNNLDDRNVANASDATTKTMSRMATKTSFQHKEESKNLHDNDDENQFAKDEALADMPTIAIPYRSRYFKGTAGKRKTYLDEGLHNENVNTKHMRVDASCHDDEYSERDIDEIIPDTKTEEKFGSNISHINKYCKIAEKSMENFVSVISSFRCTSSSSRASGLRAPLKDVRNTCPSRSSTKVDISQFAYVPSNKNTVSTSSRI